MEDSFKVGERKIRELRQSASEEMGERWKRMQRELSGGDNVFQV